MPTGYTASVADGEVTEFNEYAMNCARAMGVAIMMRDEPQGPLDIEKCLDMSSIEHHAKSLAKAFERQKLTDEELLAKFEPVRQEEIDRHAKSRKKDALTKKRYEAMLVKVEAWKPPTSEHENMKKFMREQLVDSIGFDCGSSYHDEQEEKAEQLTPELYLAQEREAAQWDFDYHTKSLAEAKARNAERRAWIEAFLESLGQLETA